MAINISFNGPTIFKPGGSFIRTTWLERQTAETIGLVEFLSKTGNKAANQMLYDSWQY